MFCCLFKRSLILYFSISLINIFSYTYSKNEKFQNSFCFIKMSLLYILKKFPYN